MDSSQPFLTFSHMLPDVEHSDAWHLQINVYGLTKLVEEFEIALSLFEAAAEKQSLLGQEMIAVLSSIRTLMSNPADQGSINRAMQRQKDLSKETDYWAAIGNIAGRDACVTLANIKDNLSAIRYGLMRCPTMQEYIPVPEVESITSEFKADFPSYVLARYAAVHRAHIAFNRTSFEKNSTSEPFELPGIKSEGNNVMIVANMIGRSYCGTGAISDKEPGQAFALELFTQASLDKIKKAEQAIRSRFLSAETHLKAARYKQAEYPRD